MDTDVDLESYLRSKGLHTKRSGNQIFTHCMFCGEDHAKRGRLYFDDSSPESRGLYHCFLCGAKGNLRTLRRHYGDKVDDDTVPNDRFLLVLTKAARFYHENLRDDDRSWLREGRGLTDETIDRFMLGYAPTDGHALWDHLSESFSPEEIVGTGLCRNPTNPTDFLRGTLTIPYMVGPGCVQIRGRAFADGPKYQTPPGQKARLFNPTATYGTESVVVAEGELDCMVLSQMGYNAVAVPGASVWQLGWNGHFEDAKRVYVMFDPDDAGRDGAQKVAAAVGAKVKVVDLPVPEGEDPKKIDPSSLTVTFGWKKDDFDALMTEAVRKSSLLITPAMAREEWESYKGQEGLQLGIEIFDHLIRPGLLPGQVMVPLAKTNTGKSLFLLNVFQRVTMVPGQEEKKILFVSLEQTRNDWFERARRIWNFYNPETDPTKVEDGTEDYWSARFRLIDKNRVTEEQLLRALDDFYEDTGSVPDLVAVDYLGYWAQGFKGKDRYERVSDAVMSLKAVAKDAGVRIISPHQVNRGAEFGEEFDIDAGRDSGAIEETADFALPFWSPDTQKGRSVEHRTGEVVMKLSKSRHGGKGQEVKLQFGPMTLVMVPITDSMNAAKARREVQWNLRGDMEWTDAIDCHRSGLTPPELLG